MNLTNLTYFLMDWIGLQHSLLTDLRNKMNILANLNKFGLCQKVLFKNFKLLFLFTYSLRVYAHLLAHHARLTFCFVLVFLGVCVVVALFRAT